MLDIRENFSIGVNFLSYLPTSISIALRSETWGSSYMDTFHLISKTIIVLKKK